MAEKNKKINLKVNLKVNLSSIFSRIDRKLLLYLIYPFIGAIIGLIVGMGILFFAKPTSEQISAQKKETPVVLNKEILNLPSYVDLKSRQLFGKLPIEIGTTGKEEPFKTIKK